MIIIATGKHTFPSRPITKNLETKDIEKKVKG
jgi:hypothetical protein